MKTTLILLAIFVVGVTLGLLDVIPIKLDLDTISLSALYALLFFVGIGIGADKESLLALRRMRGTLIFLPFVTVLGSLAGSLIASLFITELEWRDVLAVGSGMGYYSLSSIMISEVRGETLGTIALIANLAREFITLLLAPILAKLFGAFAPIASGGATAMDTTLPVVLRYSGKEYIIVSIYSGVVITFLVPFLVSFFIGN